MKYKVISKQHNTDKCFVCGMMNDASVRSEFYECVDEAGGAILITKIIPRDIHRSYPNRMHGGVISAVLDESIGRASRIGSPDIWSVTIELAVKFRGAVPLDRPVYIESKITSLTPRAIEGAGRVFCECRNGKPAVLVSAAGKYFRVSYDDVFTDEKLTDENWFIVPEELPEYIEIPEREELAGITDTP